MISVIMPSYLGDYAGAAKMRETKFMRAVDSFLRQDYADKELIIVADGCEVTERLYHKVASKEITLFTIPKQEKFSGAVRNTGLEKVTGEIICYLDTDDYFGDGHLKSIAENFGDNDWVYMNDYVMDWNYTSHERDTQIKYSKIGTSCIAHRPTPARWGDGYGHDFHFIKQLIGKSEKIKAGKYIVCHLPGVIDV